MLVCKINSPVAGVGIAFRCASVILGIKTPLFVDWISSKADAWGVAVLIPIFCWAIIATGINHDMIIAATQIAILFPRCVVTFIRIIGPDLFSQVMYFRQPDHRLVSTCVFLS